MKHEDLKRLCRRVEETFGKEVLTPLQFEALAGSIFKHTGRLLSPTTLKRLWGYINEQQTPRKTTLDVLAAYCGWPSYDDFSKGDTPQAESGIIGGRIIRVDKDMKRGARIRLMWAPSRVCDIEYLGEMRWKVVASEGTRLSPGDTFACALIVSGEPLYLDGLRHGNDQPRIYVCGRKSGIDFLREEDFSPSY